MELINLCECLVQRMKFGKQEDNSNIDLVVFTHPQYHFEEDSKLFVVFEIIYN